ncbi:hypothetical protein ACFLY2_02540 [Patescibacteria group bacterium]
MAPQLLCHHNITLSSHNSLINSSTTFAYSSKSKIFSSFVFQNPGKSGIITLNQFSDKIFQTVNQL